MLCAAPDYLAAHGTPREPDDLKRHTLIAATGVTPTTEWQFGTGAERHSVRLAPRLHANTNDAAIAAAQAGLGIVRLISYQVTPQLAEGSLQVVLDDASNELPVHVVYREGHRAPAKVRSFVQLMVERLRADPTLAWDGGRDVR